MAWYYMVQVDMPVVVWYGMVGYGMASYGIVGFGMA